MILLREPASYSQTIQPEIKALVDKYAERTVIEEIDMLDRDSLAVRIGEVALHEMDYNLSTDEIETIKLCAAALTRKYKRDWDEYQRLKMRDQLR